MNEAKKICWRASARCESGQSGQALVEFAVTLLPLALLLCGISQFVFIYAANMTVRNATNVAARYAVLRTTASGPTVPQVEDVAKQAVLPMLDPIKATATVDPDVTVGGANGATSVQVQYNLPLIIPWVVPGKGVGDSLTLTATTIMR